MLSFKLPLITLSSKSDHAKAKDLLELECDSEVSNNSDFQPSFAKRSAPARGKVEMRRLEAQKRYDHHRKFQIVWTAKLSWAEGIMANDMILHMVKNKVCSTIDWKPCIMAQNLIPYLSMMTSEWPKRTCRNSK